MKRILSFRRVMPIAALVWSFVLSSSHLQAGETALHQAVDQLITKGFAKWKATPAQRCTDEEFIRRVYLDLTGTIPTIDAVRGFLADKRADKRDKLIDQLFASDEYARHMAVVFDVTLMERRPDKYVKTKEWRDFLAASFADNKPLDVLVRQILGADGVDEKLRPAAKFYLDRAVEKDTLVRDIGRLFLGVDLQCAQCHDHPDIDDYLHQHYHGLSVFVAGSKTFRQPDGTFVLQEMVTRELEFASVFEPDKTKKTGPRLMNVLMKLPEVVEGEEYVEKPSRTVRAVPKFSLRKLLAEKLPSNETPEFARNMANRLWAKMMGRGLVHPLDMHHAGNPPTHPELLDLLAKQLSETKYDAKTFLRELALSETYQRSSEIPEGIDPKNVPPESFAVANMKGLTPEQLFHSLLQATAGEKQLAAQIEDTLKEDEAAYKELLADKEKLDVARVEEKAKRIAQFVSVFGSSPGQPEVGFQASLPQALFLANGETITSWITPGGDNLTEKLLKIDDASKLTEQAYLNVLSRLPGDEESKLAVEHLTKYKDERRTAVIELVWSLVASAEFRLNH